MVVYVVMVITDYEYGCRSIEKAYATREQAEKAIAKLGQQTVDFWDGSQSPLYTIEELEVEPEQ